MHDAAELAQSYRRFAERECKGYSPLYHALALAVAADEDILRFIARMPVPQPNLFFAAVQRLAGADAMPRDGAALRALVDARGDDLARVMRTHRTQTNEVGRCTVLLPALPTGPLALLEVGASAGLCLLLDRFGYEFTSAHVDAGRARVGDASAPVQLHCVVTGDAPIPSAPPHIVWRRGLDRDPIDVQDDEAVRWLLACVWADHRERRARLAAAVEMARANPPTILAGDLVDDLRATLRDVPAEATLVVFHSAVLSYVSPERREAFASILAETARTRDVVWISNEAPGVVREFAAPASDVLRFLVARTRFTNGRRHDEVLAIAHPHGAHMSWL